MLHVELLLAPKTLIILGMSFLILNKNLHRSLCLHKVAFVPNYGIGFLAVVMWTGLYCRVGLLSENEKTLQEESRNHVDSRTRFLMTKIIGRIKHASQGTIIQNLPSRLNNRNLIFAINIIGRKFLVFQSY